MTSLRRLAPIASLLLVLVFAAGCGSGPAREAAATVTVTVPASETPTTEQPVPQSQTKDAAVAVAGKGFSQDDTSVSYGIVLKNKSATEDALDVTVNTNFVDASGTILESESDSVNVIPAGETFYLGGDAFTEGGARVVRMETYAEVGQSETAAYPLPVVSDLRLRHEEYIGLKAYGVVENTLDKPLSQFARIGIVVFDARNRVVSGGFTYLDADLPPGRRAAFDTSIDAAPSTVRYVRASVDNSVTSD